MNPLERIRTHHLDRYLMFYSRHFRQRRKSWGSNEDNWLRKQFITLRERNRCNVLLDRCRMCRCRYRPQCQKRGTNFLGGTLMDEVILIIVWNYLLHVIFTQNQFEQVLLNLYVRQEAHVVSYLTPLTGYVVMHALTLEIYPVYLTASDDVGCRKKFSIPRGFLCPMLFISWEQCSRRMLFSWDRIFPRM